MTWLIALNFLRKYGAQIAVVCALVWVSMEFVDRGRDIVRLEATNAVLSDQLDIYRANAVKIAQVRREVLTCLDRIDEVQAMSDDWQARYESAWRKPARVIRVPVEVAAPGTSCDEAVIDIAGWLAEEVSQ